MIDVDKIIVVEDFLPKWLQDSFDQRLKDYTGWKISNVLSPFIVDGEQGQEWYCTRVLYEANRVQWDDAGGITSILNDYCTREGIFRAIPDAQVKALLRIRLNGTFKLLPVYPHEDAEPEETDVWSIIYYLNDSDGGTRFYHDQGHTLATTVPFKKGSAVIFPARYFHNAETPVDHNVRISAALMYALESKLNG
jgi:hypothetical protein